MRKRAMLVLGLALFAVCFGLNAFAERVPTTGKSTEIADAAKKFVATLDDGQLGKVVFDFKDEAQRKRWSNFPSGIFQRAGLRMGDLTPPQREAAMAVLAAALSPQGYEKTQQIVQADEVLKNTEGGGRGGPGGP